MHWTCSHWSHTVVTGQNKCPSDWYDLFDIRRVHKSNSPIFLCIKLLILRIHSLHALNVSRVVVYTKAGIRLNEWNRAMQDEIYRVVFSVHPDCLAFMSKSLKCSTISNAGICTVVCGPSLWQTSHNKKCDFNLMTYDFLWLQSEWLLYDLWSLVIDDWWCGTVNRLFSSFWAS